jgi:bacteriocin-like protein
MNMTQIARTETPELSIEELDQISGGMIVPTNEASIIANIKAKDFANGSVFTGQSSFHDTIDLNDNLP